MAAILGILGICLLFIEFSSVLTVSIPRKVYRIPRGEDVTIPCNFTRPKAGDIVQVKWAAVPDVAGDPPIGILTFTSPNTIKVEPKYKNRVTLVHNIPRGKADLQLKRVTSKDTRVYVCEVKVLNNNKYAVPNKGSQLVVLVAPSPICKIVGVTEYYENIKLTCRSEEEMPGQNYSWQSYNTSKIPRPIPPMATDQKGVLSLYNITEETSGFFVCTSTNEIGSERCKLTLAVMPPSESKATIGKIVGAVVAVAAVVGAIILCCYCCGGKESGAI